MLHCSPDLYMLMSLVGLFGLLLVVCVQTDVIEGEAIIFYFILVFFS